jgi:FixJ family two-component response regulator
VIVVDDDRSIRRALRMQLSLAGFSVLVFDSAKSLLASKFPSRNACLLLDVYMPGMGGLELYRALKAEGRGLPVILMSGRDDDQTRKLGKAQRITCLFKPFDQSALLRAIWKVMPEPDADAQIEIANRRHVTARR